MTIEIAVPTQQLLKHQHELPEQDRQSSIFLRFREPVNMALTSDFYRIHLTAEMKREGNSEREFYKPELFQPSRMNQAKACSACGQDMVKVLISTWKCQNRKCRRVGASVESGPTRGVIQVDVPDNAIVNREEIEATKPVYDRVTGNLRGYQKLYTAPNVPLKVTKTNINACVLRLDRRYDELVLAAIYRTAGAICDQYGWVLL